MGLHHIAETGFGFINGSHSFTETGTDPCSWPFRYRQMDHTVNLEHAASTRGWVKGVEGGGENNSHDNVYGAVVMTKVIARVHPVHLMNVDWAPGGRQPSDQANQLGLWVHRKLAAIIPIHHRHCYYYYYSARKLILIFFVPRRVEGWVDLSTAVKVHSPCSRLYIAAAVAINTTISGVIRTWILSHRSQTR